MCLCCLERHHYIGMIRRKVLPTQRFVHIASAGLVLGITDVSYCRLLCILVDCYCKWCVAETAFDRFCHSLPVMLAYMSPICLNVCNVSRTPSPMWLSKCHVISVPLSYGDSYTVCRSICMSVSSSGSLHSEPSALEHWLTWRVRCINTNRWGHCALAPHCTGLMGFLTSTDTPLWSLHRLPGMIYLLPSAILAPWTPSKLLSKLISYNSAYTPRHATDSHPSAPPVLSSVIYGANQRNLFDWLVGWLVGWLVDWLIDWYYVPVYICSSELVPKNNLYLWSELGLRLAYG